MLGFCLATQASSVRLLWDPNPPAENVTGYKVYWSTTTGVFNDIPHTIGGATEHVIPNLAPGTTYFFVVTAYNGAGESDFSQEVSAALPGKPNAVINLRIGNVRPDKP
jgi:hypothetical protein